MGLWDLIKTAIIVEGIDHMLKDKKHWDEPKSFDNGDWRREIDKENDRYRGYFHDDDL